MTIIQIGSNHGNDDLSGIIKENKSDIRNLILVEPIALHHAALVKRYSGFPMTIKQCAIVDDPKTSEVSFYYHREDGPLYEVASLSREHILKHSVFNPRLTLDGIVESRVSAMTINNLFRQHEIKVVDLLMIDAEGFDERIIRSVEFETFKILNIVYENLHIDTAATTCFLEAKGYSVIQNWGTNGWSSWAFLNI